MNEDAQRVADMLAEVVQAMADGLEYEGQDAEEYLQDQPLEIEVLGKRQLGEDDWSVTSVEVTLGLGGPTQWVEFTETDTAVVHHVWSSDPQRRHLSPELAEQLAVVWGIDEVLS